VTLRDLVVEPAVATTDTPIGIKFRVVCNRTTGSSNVPKVRVAVEARRGEARVTSVEVNCQARSGQHWTSMPWEGEGQIALGKLPAGKDVITLVVPSPGAGWTVPAPEPLTIEVREAPR
jgi:hypothetical protein